MQNPTYLNFERTVIRIEESEDKAIIVEPRSDPKMFADAVAGKYGPVADYVPDVDDGPVIPDVVVSRLQAKAALLQMGLLPQADALVAAMDPLTKLAWTEANSFKRSSPLLNAMIEYMQWPDGTPLDQADLDELFSIAQTIEV